MTSPTELTKIINSLMGKTRDGSLSWDETGAGEYGSASSRFLYIIASRDGDDRAPFLFEVYLVKSKEESVLLSSYTTHAGTSAALGAAIRELYDGAKLSAHGIQSSLSEEILRDLG